MGRMRTHLVHDMRTPLQLIYSCAQMIQTELNDPDAPAARYAQLLMENVQCLKDMIADELESVCGSADVVRIAAGLCRRMDPEAAARGTTILFSSNTAEFRMRVDGAKLIRALQNLISNALRFTPAGGNIRVDLRAMNDSVEICVSDTGPGIEPRRQKRIFEPRETQGGYGMGLVIARKFARQMDGRIDVYSVPGKGAAFTLYLPVRGDAV